MSRILIADDQNDVLEALRIVLKGEGQQTDAVTSLAGILQALEKKDYALLIMDLNYTRDTTSGQEGLEVIPKIQALDNTLPIVIMTAWATIDLAVEAMKRGARDFIPKPWDNERLLSIVRTQIELGSALRKGRRLEAANQLLRGNAPNIIAESPRMRPVLEIISRVAPSDANVLITGENGTGKGLVARAIHALSSRASHTMITVNMGGLSEGIFESELFGHVKGAFTDAKTDRAGRFELADESTLFMDEIANVPMNQQAKLLRVIETGEIERVVLMTQGQQVKPNDLGLTSGISDTPRLEDMSLEDVEAFLIKKALSRFDGNARKAAEALGLSRSAFYRRLQQYGL